MSDDVESALLRELREIAGVREGTTFDIGKGHTRFEVSYSGGSSSSLTLRARYDVVAKAVPVVDAREASYRSSARPAKLHATRPMKIELRRENDADRASKESGVNREHQTGDANFDAAVYVDTPTTDDGVLGSVLGANVRAAVLALLGLGFSWVKLDDDDGMVKAYLSDFASLDERDERAPEIVASFTQLLEALPPVAATGESHPEEPFSRPLTIMSVLAAVLFFGGAPLFFLVADGMGCMEASDDGDGSNLRGECVPPAVVGLVVAAVAGALACALASYLVAPKLRGRSNSAARIGQLVVVAFALAAELAFFAVSFAGFALR